MDASHPNFMDCVTLKRASEWLGKAQGHLETNEPEAALVDLRLVMEQVLKALPGVQSSATKKAMVRAYAEGKRSVTEPDS